MIQLAEGEHITTACPIEVSPAQGTGSNGSVEQSSGNNTSKEVYSVFGDERNFASDMPIEDVIHALQVAEGEDALLDTRINLVARESVLTASPAVDGPTRSTESLQRQVNEGLRLTDVDCPRIHGVSIVSDTRNYLNEEMSFQELSHILEAAEAEGSSGQRPGSKGGPFLNEGEIVPAPDPLSVGNVSIIRDFRNYVGDVSLPDVAGVLGVADEAEGIRMLGGMGVTFLNFSSSVRVEVSNSQHRR